MEYRVIQRDLHSQSSICVSVPTIGPSMYVKNTFNPLDLCGNNGNLSSLLKDVQDYNNEYYVYVKCWRKYALTPRDHVKLLCVIDLCMADLFASIRNTQTHCTRFELKIKVDINFPLYSSGDRIFMKRPMPQL